MTPTCCLVHSRLSLSSSNGSSGSGASLPSTGNRSPPGGHDAAPGPACRKTAAPAAAPAGGMQGRCPARLRHPLAPAAGAAGPAEQRRRWRPPEWRQPCAACSCCGAPLQQAATAAAPLAWLAARHPGACHRGEVSGAWPPPPPAMAAPVPGALPPLAAQLGLSYSSFLGAGRAELGAQGAKPHRRPERWAPHERWHAPVHHTDHAAVRAGLRCRRARSPACQRTPNLVLGETRQPPQICVASTARTLQHHISSPGRQDERRRVHHRKVWPGAAGRPAARLGMLAH